MTDRDAVATAGASLILGGGPVRATIGLARGLNDHAGTLGITRLELSRPIGARFFASTGVSATFADAQQMRREYGVSALESARRQSLIDAGDERLRGSDGRAYRRIGGLAQAGVSASAVYALTRHWSAMGLAELAWPADEAAASPLVRRRTQPSGGLGLFWRK